MKEYIELLKLLKVEVQNNNGETFNLKVKFFHYGKFAILKALIKSIEHNFLPEGEIIEAYKLMAEIEELLNYII